MKSYTYNFEIKDLLTQFIAAFDDVIIKRYDASRRSKEEIAVRYVLAPKQRIMYDIVNKAQNITLPVVAINMTGISRDTERVFNKLDNLYNPTSKNDGSLIKMPVPINISVSMSILARYMQDMEQILSNFIPYNNPYIILSWKEPSNVPNQIIEIRSEVTWDGNISLTEPSDIAYSDKFRIIADTTFVIKGWLFKNQNEIAKPIYTIDTNFIDINKDLIITRENYAKLSIDPDIKLCVDMFTLSAMPVMTNIFLNEVSGLTQINTYFDINNSLSSNYTHFLLQGKNLAHTTALLLSTTNTIVGNISTINTRYSEPITGYVVDPINYTILADNLMSIMLPNFQGACDFNFVIANPAGWYSSYDINSFTFRSV